MLEESTGNFSAARNVYDWYQTQTHVILNVMIKNLKESDVKVRLIDETLDVACQLADGSLFKLHFNLFKPIYVSESNWSVTPSKLEIKLKKTDKKRWQSLEVIPEKGTKRNCVTIGITTGSNQVKKHLTALNADDGLKLGTPRTKHDWYQNNHYVVVAVHIRNLNPEDVRVVFTETTVDVDCKIGDGSDYKLHLNLFQPIVVSESTYQVTLSKLELKMRKSDSIRWKNLEAVPFLLKNSGVLKVPSQLATTTVEVVNDSTHSSDCIETYRDENITITRIDPGPDANCMGAAVATTSKDPNCMENDQDGQSLEQVEDKQANADSAAVDHLFREIYEKGGDEVRRAMNKSFIEGAGAVLTSSWDQVAKDKVEVYLIQRGDNDGDGGTGEVISFNIYTDRDDSVRTDLVS